MIARVLPVPAPASTHMGPQRVRGDLALLGVERVEDVVGGGGHGYAVGLGGHRRDPVMGDRRPGHRTGHWISP